MPNAVKRRRAISTTKAKSGPLRGFASEDCRNKAPAVRRHVISGRLRFVTNERSRQKDALLEKDALLANPRRQLSRRARRLLRSRLRLAEFCRRSDLSPGDWRTPAQRLRRASRSRVLSHLRFRPRFPGDPSVGEAEPGDEPRRGLWLLRLRDLRPHQPGDLAALAAHALPRRYDLGNGAVRGRRRLRLFRFGYGFANDRGRRGGRGQNALTFSA